MELKGGESKSGVAVSSDWAAGVKTGGERSPDTADKTGDALLADALFEFSSFPSA